MNIKPPFPELISPFHQKRPDLETIHSQNKFENFLMAAFSEYVFMYFSLDRD